LLSAPVSRRYQGGERWSDVIRNFGELSEYMQVAL